MQKTLFAEHRYVVGDNDSRNDARAYCFIEVKKKLTEQAGVFIESNVEVRNAIVTKSDVRSLSSALIRIERLRDERVNDGLHQVVACAARTVVDLAKIEAELSAIAKNDTTRQRVLEQQAKRAALDADLARLRASLKVAPEREALELRGRKDVVTGEIDIAEQEQR